MAAVEQHSYPENSTPTVIPGVTPIQWRKLTIPTAGAAANPGKLFVSQDDHVNVVVIPRGYVVADGYVAHSATLGASATATLRRGTTDLTAASTAGGASMVRKSIIDTASIDSDDWLNVLIEGADIDATDTILEVYVTLKEDMAYAA